MDTARLSRVFWIVSLSVATGLARAEGVSRPANCKESLAMLIRKEALDNVRAQSDLMAHWNFDDFAKTAYGRETLDAVASAMSDAGNVADVENACRCLSTRTGLNYKLLTLKAREISMGIAAKGYRKSLDIFREVMTHAGEIARKYITGTDMEVNAFRWNAVEKLYKKGKFQGSFGHPVHGGAVEIMSKAVAPVDMIPVIEKQSRAIGSDLRLPGGKSIPIRQLEMGPMVGVSGMSFPQLSAQSHLSLMYMHLKLAKEDGLRGLLNTGEGGPLFHIALLKGDRDELTRQILSWGKESGQLEVGSWDEAQVISFVDQLMKSRDDVFKEFTQADIEKAQIVAQYGSALNGIRGEGNRVDFDKLKQVADSPFVAMTQFKLKQAAKRGAKVDPSKIDHVVAALREIDKGKPFKVPEVIPEASNFEEVAKLVIATKLVTRKPVSLKLGVGDVKDFDGLIDFLTKADALPDHIQLDGRGPTFSPGSGNAPPMNNTSLPINEAIIVVDAVLKKHGVRDRVFVEGTGDVLLPPEAVERLALGADGVSAARLWMGMGLGCAQVRACANGNCPYGIAARSSSIFAAALDPRAVGPRGYEAAKNWWHSYTQALSETGTSDWRTLRTTAGLASGPSVLRKNDGQKMVQLRTFYNEDYVADLMEGVMSRKDIRKFVFGGKTD